MKKLVSLLLALTCLLLLAACAMRPDDEQLDVSQPYGDQVKLLHLNGSSQEKRERIRAAMDETGYQPDAAAQMLRSKTARLAGSNPCPPMVLGVGIGGDFEYCAQLAKQALCRELGPNPDPYYAALEKQMLAAVNATGVGPQGFGGNTTALAVQIEAYPTHIAGLPVAVNVGCHVTRHQTVVL